MNCNPFTKGHKYLIEKASKENDVVHLFILTEDKSEFSTKDRINMVKLGTKHLKMFWYMRRENILFQVPHFLHTL